MNMEEIGQHSDLSQQMNRDSYNRIASSWNQARSGFFRNEQAYLDTVLSAAPPDSTLLDLGCGTGYPMADYIVAKGRHVIGIDQSEAMLEIAKARLPQERWVHASMEDYTLSAEFSGAVIWDSLFHLPRASHRTILERVIARLPSGGRLMLTVGGSAHPPFRDFMYGEQFFYDSNTPEQTELLITQLGYKLLIAEYMNVPDGKNDKGRYAIVAEKTT